MTIQSNNRPGSYTVIPAQLGKLPSLSVMHSCGHSAGYAYGAERFAQGDGPSMAGKACLSCHGGNELRRYAQKRGEIYQPRLDRKH